MRTLILLDETRHIIDTHDKHPRLVGRTVHDDRDGVVLAVCKSLFKREIQPEVLCALDLQMEVCSVADDVSDTTLSVVLDGSATVEANASKCLACLKFTSCALAPAVEHARKLSTGCPHGNGGVLTFLFSIVTLLAAVAAQRSPPRPPERNGKETDHSREKPASFRCWLLL